MDSKKKNISLLLLAGFFFPQAANSMHYFIVPHTGDSEILSAHNFANPVYDYHTCDYHLTAIKFLIPKVGDSRDIYIPDLQQTKTFHYFSGHITKLAFNYTLRGPPRKVKSTVHTNNA